MLFAFVAGAATAVSPCVLPVLPVALAAGATGGRRRPLGVVAGLVVSFTFATVALVYLLSALGLPDKLFRTLAIVVLAVAGIALVVPASSRPRRGVAHAARAARARRAARRRLRLRLPARPEPRARLRALRRADPGRRHHGLCLAGLHRRPARRCALVQRRQRAGALRADARRPPRDRAAGAPQRALPAGDGRRDDRRRGGHGDRARHPLREPHRGKPAGRAREPHQGARGGRRDARQARRPARRRRRRQPSPRRPRARTAASGFRCSARRPSFAARSAGSTPRMAARSRCARCAAGWS